jgi:single-strand DNA-binding protein
MPNLNHVHLIGHLTRDPELKYTPGGMAICEFGLAVTDRVKKGDDWTEKPMFIDIVFFSKTAEVANEYLKKGSPCMVFGRLDFQQWEKDGQKRSKHVIVGDKMQMLGGKGGAKEEAPPAKSQSMKQDVNRKALAERDPDDIPFSLLWFVIPIASALAAIA